MNEMLEPISAEAIADLLALGNSDQALSAAEAAHLRQPDDTEMMVVLGRALLACGQPARAAQLLIRATTVKPDQPQDVYRLCLSLGLEHDFITESGAVINAAIERYSSDVFIAAYAGALKFRLDSKDQSGVALLRSAIKAEAFHWGPIYEAYFQAMTHEGRLEEAIDDLTRASQQLDQSHPWSPVHISALYHLALAQHALGEKSVLRETLATILSAVPEMETRLRPLILSAFVGDEDFPASQSILSQAENESNRLIAILSGKSSSQNLELSPLERSLAVSYLVGSQYRLLPVSRIDRSEIEKLVARGMSRDFIHLLKSGPLACLEAASPPAQGKAWRKDFAVSQRVRDTLDTLDRGSKSSLNPYTSALDTTRHMLASDTFLFSNNGDPYLVAQWAETDVTLSDTFWIMPRLKLIVYFHQSNILTSTTRSKLSEMFKNILDQPNDVSSFIAKEVKKVVVSQHPIPHIGHYVWNGVSAWSSFFRYCVGGLLPDAVAYHGNLRLMADVTELYPQECEQINEVILFENESDSCRYMIDNGCMILTLKSDYISEDLARRMTSWAWNSVSEKFCQQIRKFRSSCYPILLVNLRLENRSWIEQRDGFRDLFNSLIKIHPNIGFILDGINSGVTQGWTHAQMSVDPEYELAAYLEIECPGVPIFSSIGCSIAESLVIGDVCDSFVGHVGAGMAKYRWISNLPGVAFSNETFSRPRDRDGRLYDHHREAAKKAIHVSSENISDEPGPKTSRSNFSMDSAVLISVVEKSLSTQH